jgi:hypothetical protein
MSYDHVVGSPQWTEVRQRVSSRPLSKDSSMRLEIFIASHCDNCQEARHIAETARSVEGLEVCGINLDSAPLPASPSIVAVPTYVLEGRVVSLGNPSREAFLAMLRQAVMERAL